MALKMYAGYYTRCDHCGIYDRDPGWCVLCAKPKEAGRKAAPAQRPASPSENGSARAAAAAPAK
jgi:hypothetical protein